VHFKQTREIMHTIKGMKLSAAKKFLNDVLQ
jgi:ribosomal protein L22